MATDGAAPTVTIVVSCFNHADYIEACINSIVRQTYSPIEILTYDDGSSDASPQILEQLARKHQFSFESQQNKGLSEALNHALSNATGKYFCSIGSDDIAMLDKTEKQVAYMEANPEVAVCGGNALFIDSAGRLCNKRQRFHPARDLDFRDLFENATPGFVSPSAMIRTDTLRAVGGYRPDIPLEDLYLWLKIAQQNQRIHVLNDVLLYYRKHEHNTYKDVEFMFHSITKTIDEYRDHPSYPRVIARHINSLLLNAAKQDNSRVFSEILKRLPLKHYNTKTLRAILRNHLP